MARFGSWARLPVDAGVRAAGGRVREDVGSLSGRDVSNSAGLDDAAAAAAAAGRWGGCLRCELGAGFGNNLGACCSARGADGGRASFDRRLAGGRSRWWDVRDGGERRGHLVALHWLGRSPDLLGDGDG